MFYAFDIETMPNSSKLDSLPEPEIKTGNLKDPAKIEEKRAEARAEQIEKMALNPLYGRICAAVFVAPGMDGELEAARFAAGDDDEEEALLIADCFRVLAADCARIVTWNGMGFDFPFLFKRALILGIPLNGVPVLAHWCKRYTTGSHIDLMQVWGNWNTQGFEKLDNVAGLVIDDRKIEIDFREFPELIKTEEGKQKILDYCEQDVRLTYRLFERFNGILF
jgi:DNA polymerase elongation subunit (family B)